MALQRQDDSTVQDLYLISKQVVEELGCAEDEKLRALHVISEAHEKQYGKILACLLEEPPNLPKMLQYVVDGREHSKRLKQRYDDEAEHEDTVTEAVTPIEEPSKITNTTSSMIDLQAMQFVDIYKKRTSSQRMNWKRCYDQGVKESKLTRYATISSLRVTYNEYKKRK